MLTCTLDGNSIMDRRTLHDTLTASLQLPDWYGRNLGALYDCLTDLQEETEIRILNPDALEANLGSYARSLVGVLHRASSENSRIKYIVLQNEPPHCKQWDIWP